jgi:cysteine desulfurase
MGIDLMSVSSHKINGPKGVGFLFAKESVVFSPQVFGGEQERKRRAGTENVPGIVGFATAIQIIQQEREERSKSYLAFRTLLMDELRNEQIEFEMNGNSTNLSPHVINLSFKGISIESFLVNLDISGIAASSGSACTAGSIDPSHVLVAMFGKGSEKLRSSVRFSFGLGNTEEQIKELTKRIAAIVRRLIK